MGGIGEKVVNGKCAHMLNCPAGDKKRLLDEQVAGDGTQQKTKIRMASGGLKARQKRQCLGAAQLRFLRRRQLTQGLEDPGQAGVLRAAEDTKRHVNHLQVLGARHAVDGARPGADVQDVGGLDPGDAKVRALAHGVLQDAAEAVEDDGALAAVDCKQNK